MELPLWSKAVLDRLDAWQAVIVQISHTGKYNLSPPLSRTELFVVEL